ncbi:MAG: tyrosine-protein phosphatase [Bulleidia sp.]
MRNRDRTMETQSLHLEGVNNARTLAGYVNREGKRIRAKRLLRSGMPGDATVSDLEKLKEQNLGVIVDFRTDSEKGSKEDPVIEGVRYEHLHVSDENLDRSISDAVTRIYEKDPIQALIEMLKSGAMNEDLYVNLVECDAAKHGYGRFFQILLETDPDQSILWHCTGGKDRAGTAAVLVMSALDMDEETILDDFGMTNAFNQKRIEGLRYEVMKRTDDPEVIADVQVIAGVRREYMKRMLDHLNEKYGSAKNFITTRLGVDSADLNRLKDLFLE